MKRTITVSQLANELKDRLDNNQTVDCCKEELINLVNLASEKMGQEMIEVSWKE